MEMTHRERLLNAIRGKETDRIPWSPFLAYYWQYVPEDIQKKGEISYLLQMGADPLLRGPMTLFKTSVQNCNLTYKEEGNKRYELLETKVGTLVKEYTFSDSAQSWFLTGHPVKSEEDFKILQYITENTKFKNCELIQEDYSFEEFYNWYDYFVETESYCNVYRFY